MPPGLLQDLRLQLHLLEQPPLLRHSDGRGGSLEQQHLLLRVDDERQHCRRPSALPFPYADRRRYALYQRPVRVLVFI